MPDLPDILASDSRLAEEAAGLAAARKKGDVKGMAVALSPESSRRLISWESRIDICAKLDAAEQTLCAMEERLEASLSWSNATDAATGERQRIMTLAALSAEPTETLLKLDLDLVAEEERLSSTATELETLAEKVDILRKDLSDDALCGANPMETTLLEAMKMAFARLRELEIALGSRLNEHIIPTPEEAAASEKFAAIRVRQLQRLKLWDERSKLLEAARRSAQAVDKTLTAPKADGITAALAEMLEKAMQEVEESCEAARASIAPELEPLKLPDAFGNRPNSVPQEEASASAQAPTGNDLAQPESVGAPDELGQAALQRQDRVHEAHTIRKSLTTLLTIIPIWFERLPNMPNPKLIPPEADCVGKPKLAEVRARMLGRRDRREKLEAELSNLREAALKLKTLLANPMSDLEEASLMAAELKRDADRFSADLEEPGQQKAAP